MGVDGGRSVGVTIRKKFFERIEEDPEFFFCKWIVNFFFKRLMGKKWKFV